MSDKLGNGIFEGIKDAQGHNRFIEGEIELHATQDETTLLYGRYSLSGSHIMFVIAGQIPTGNVLKQGFIANIELPEWILNKIVNVYPQDGAIEYKQLALLDTAGVNAVYQKVSIGKSSNKVYIWNFTTSSTVSVDKYFRLQFDLLIDNASA